MIYFMVVVAPPYTGFNGCSSVTYGNQDMFLVLWALVIIWDSRKCECIVQRPSSDWEGSIVDAHIGARHSSMWAILVLKIDSAYISSILDRDGGNASLTTMVYRDGKPLFFFFLLAARLNLDIGVVYYLYLFGRSCAETGGDNR